MMSRRLRSSPAPKASAPGTKRHGQPYTAPRMSSATVSIEVASRLDDLRDEWPVAADRSDNVFATWDWLSTWWTAFGRERPLAVGVARAPGRPEPVAIVPLYFAARRPVRVLRPLGHGVSDQLGPVCAVGDRPVAAHALRSLLHDRVPEWDVFIGDEFPADIDWAAALGGRTLARAANPVAQLAGTTWDTWLASRSTNFRSALRRPTRALDRAGTVTYRTTSSRDLVDADLDLLFSLHDARWRTARGGSRAFARRREFHRQFVRVAFDHGWLRLRFLEVDGRAVAGLYNLRFAGSESHYQGGRDPAFERFSVGTLLHAHAIREAIADGCREYRFLRGDEPYKRRFADRDPGLESVGVARTARGRATLGAVAPLPRLPRWAVRRVPSPFAWGTGGSPVWGPA